MTDDQITAQDIDQAIRCWGDYDTAWATVTAGVAVAAGVAVRPEVAKRPEVGWVARGARDRSPEFLAEALKVLVRSRISPDVRAFVEHAAGEAINLLLDHRPRAEGGRA